MSVFSTEVQLVARPRGEPAESDFRLVQTELGQPGPDQVLVRNVAVSVDPYMRGRMNDAPSYVPPFQLDQPLTGGAVGEVIESSVEDLPIGTLVLHDLGWREYALLMGDQARPIDVAEDLSPTLYLGALGMPGLTAYVGLFDIAAFKKEDTVFVSGAAGAVGTMVGQLARLHGAKRVIGSAGSSAKVRFLTEELGFDAAFNYHDGPVRAQLKQSAPEGIDVYFDNVGGEHLEAAISTLNTFGRVSMCGSVSVYNATERTPGPGNLSLVTGKRLTLRGFIVGDHADRQPDFIAEAAQWLRSGELKVKETVVDGIENAVPAFIGLLRGENTGKMVVRLG